MQQSFKNEKNLRDEIYSDSINASNSPKEELENFEIKENNFLTTFENKKPIKREIPKAKNKINQHSIKLDKSEIKQKNIKKDATSQNSISNREKEFKRENFEKRIDELFALKEENLKNRELEKQKKEEDELRKCPFSPSLNNYMNKISSEKIEDRLLKIGQEQQKNREKVKEI